MNNTHCFGSSSTQLQLAQQLIKGGTKDPAEDPFETKKADVIIVEKIKEKLNSLKGDTKGCQAALEKAIRDVEVRMNTSESAKYLPSLVKSVKQQVVHANSKTLLLAPPVAWRTMCGWYFHASNYEVLERDHTEVTCAKCQASALWHGGGGS